MNLQGIRAVTFDVFGTLLDVSAWPGRDAYADLVRAVARGELPHRPLSEWFAERRIGLDGLAARPGVAAALGRLRREYAVAALSNADSRLTRALAARFGLPWSAVLETEAAGAFKPDPRFYRAALHQLGLASWQVVHAASHRFDLDAAAGLGFRTAYLAWPGYAEPAPAGTYDVQVADACELAARLLD